MNQYLKVIISVIIDGSEVTVVLNYMEATCISKICQGMKQIEIGPAMKCANKTIYNVSSIARKKLHVRTNKEMKELVKHIKFEELLVWMLSFSFIF